MAFNYFDCTQFVLHSSVHSTCHCAFYLWFYCVPFELFLFRCYCFRFLLFGFFSLAPRPFSAYPLSARLRLYRQFTGFEWFTLIPSAVYKRNNMMTRNTVVAQRRSPIELSKSRYRMKKTEQTQMTIYNRTLYCEMVFFSHFVVSRSNGIWYIDWWLSVSLLSLISCEWLNEALTEKFSSRLSGSGCIISSCFIVVPFIALFIRLKWNT